MNPFQWQSQSSSVMSSWSLDNIAEARVLQYMLQNLSFTNDCYMQRKCQFMVPKFYSIQIHYIDPKLQIRGMLHKTRGILHTDWFPWVMTQDHQPRYLQMWIHPLVLIPACHLWMLKLQCRQFWVLCIILLETLFLHRIAPYFRKGRYFLRLAFS